MHAGEASCGLRLKGTKKSNRQKSIFCSPGHGGYYIVARAPRHGLIFISRPGLFILSSLREGGSYYYFGSSPLLTHPRMDYLTEYGLVGAFDTVCLCFGDDDCLKYDEDEEDSLSFLEVQGQSRDVASQLVHLFGVAPGDHVLFIVDSEEESEGAEISALLGTWRAHAVFVPCSRQQLPLILENIDPTAAIVIARDDNALVVRELAKLGVHRVVCQTPRGHLVRADAVDIRTDIPPPPQEEVDRDDCCYILHTSGSTGAPKGVRGTVRALVSRLLWQHRHYPLEQHEVCLRRTPMTFVDSLVEILFPLLSGVPLYVPPAASFKALGLAGAAMQLSQQCVSRVTVLPSQLMQALHLNPSELTSDAWPSLELCTVSGEPCSVELIARFQLAFPTCILLNLYGSTEVSGDICAAVLSPAEQTLPLDNDEVVPIGKCMVGHCIVAASFVKSGESEKGVVSITTAAEGEKGELVYCGPFCADGYHRLLQETSERFLKNVVIDGLAAAEKGIYRTGDICSQNGDVFYWHGRKDLQSKLAGGLRIEIEAVEAALRDALALGPSAVGGVGGVGALAALAVEWGEQSEGAGRRIVAVVETAAVGAASAILERLQETHVSLPAAYVPVLVLTTPHLPRNATGKLDRKHIADFFNAHVEQANTDPTTFFSTSHQVVGRNRLLVPSPDWDNRVASIVASVLPSIRSAAEIDLQKDSFFSLGGDSVAFIVFCWKVRQELQITLPKILWREPLESILVELRREAKDASPLVPMAKAKKPRLESDDMTNSLALCWVKTMTRCIDASPLLLNGGVFIGDHSGLFQCLSAATGDVVWAVQLKACGSDAGEAEAEMHIEGAAAASSDSKLIYVTSYCAKSVDGILMAPSFGVEAHRHSGSLGSGIVWALEVQTGRLCWSTALPGEIKSRVMVGSDAGIVWASTYAGIYALSATDGTVRSCFFETLSFYAAPVASPSHLYCASTSGHLVCISLADRQATWAIDGTFSHLEGAAQAPIFATPALLHHHQDDKAADWRLVYGCIDSILRCVSVSVSVSGGGGEPSEPLWINTHSTRPIFSSCCVLKTSNTVAFGSHDSWLRCVHAATGLLIWETDCKAVIFSSPVAFLDDQYVCAATTAGDVLVIEAKSGSVLKTRRLRGEIYSGPCVSDTSSNSADVIVGCRDDCIYKLTFTA